MLELLAQKWLVIHTYDLKFHFNREHGNGYFKVF